MPRSTKIPTDAAPPVTVTPHGARAQGPGKSGRRTVWGASLVAGLALLGALTACGGGDDGGSGLVSAGQQGGDTPAGVSNGRPAGLYESWETGTQTVYNTMCGVDGYCYNYPYDISTFEELHLFFNANGYVFDGTPKDPKALTCEQGEATSKACRPYTIDGTHITIGKDKPRTYAFNPQTQVLTLGGYDHPFLHVKPSPKGRTLNGSFNYISCAYSTCSRANYTFAPDGTFAYFGSSSYVTGMASVYASGGSGTQNRGRYAIDGYAITFTMDNGKQGTVFFSVDDKGENIQVSSSSFSSKSD